MSKPATLPLGQMSNMGMRYHFPSLRGITFQQLIFLGFPEFEGRKNILHLASMIPSDSYYNPPGF
jgi:hypothetical protein